VPRAADRTREQYWQLPDEYQDNAWRDPLLSGTLRRPAGDAVVTTSRSRLAGASAANPRRLADSSGGRGPTASFLHSRRLGARATTFRGRQRDMEPFRSGPGLASGAQGFSACRSHCRRLYCCRPAWWSAVGIRRAGGPSGGDTSEEAEAAARWVQGAPEVRIVATLPIMAMLFRCAKRACSIEAAT
jgi:hypothetical protein